MPGATGTSVAEMERHVNELSDEVKQEVSAVINASARQSIRPYNTQVINKFELSLSTLKSSFFIPIRELIHRHYST